MTTGTEFYDAFVKVYDPSQEAQPSREKIILEAVRGGKTPSWFRVNPWPEYAVKIGGSTLRYRISPFIAIGNDEDWLLPPMAPSTIQSIADSFASCMLSRKMVTDAFMRADLQVPMQVPNVPPWNLAIPGPAMWKPEAFRAHTEMVRAKASDALRVGKRVSGHSKNVVCGPGLTSSNLAIFGGYTGRIGPKKGPDDPLPQVDGWAYQSYPGPHPASWIDYSQCGRIAFRRAYLDDREVDLHEIAIDPEVYVFLSDQGPFDLVYPNEPPKPGNTGNVGGKKGSGTDAFDTSATSPDTGAKIAVAIGGAALVGWGLKKIFG